MLTVENMRQIRTVPSLSHVFTVKWINFWSLCESMKRDYYLCQFCLSVRLC